MSNSNAKEVGARGQPNTSITTPPSPRRSWMKIGGMGRTRSVESMQQYHHPHPHPSPRPKSPPLTLTTGSPRVDDGKRIPMSPLDTTPKKLWENGFRSFLSKRSQQQPTSGAQFPEVPLMAPTQRQQQQQQQQQKQSQTLEKQKKSSSSQSGKGERGDGNSNDQSVRGGKIFHSIFGGSGHAQRKQRRKTKSLNELDEPMRNGKDKNCSPDSARYRRVQSQANAVIGSEADATELDLSQSLRRAASVGSTAGALVPPPIHPAQHLHQAGFFHHHDYHQPRSSPSQYLQHSHPPLPQHQQHHINPLGHRPTADYHPYQYGDANHRQVQLPYPTQPLHPPLPTHYQPVGLSSYSNAFHSPAPASMSPSSATTEIKRAFTEFHNSSRYARDSTSAYLGDDPSTRHGDMFTTGLIAQNRSSSGSHLRQYSIGSIDSNSGHRYWANPRSLPTVDENVSILKSMRMLRPFQMVDSWQAGRRYLIGPAALATCPLLQGISSLSASHHTGDAGDVAAQGNQLDKADVCAQKEGNHESATDMPLSRLPPLFGCIVLGKALLSYVVQEPQHHHQQRWWSSSLLILRQNYLLEYDQQSADTVKGLPRGYAHLQYSTSYAHSDFADALELEFFVSPCAKADKRVLTIRLQEAREKRDDWIACFNRAAQIDARDLYDYDESAEVGRGRYAAVFPARRRARGNESKELRGNNNSLSTRKETTAPTDEYDCALKIIDKKEFWRRVVKGRERADTLVRETSVQATMTSKCSKIPAFVRLRGFLETSDNIVLELELLEGLDLFQYVSSKGVLSEKEAACILRDILTVLDGLNRLGVAHRDIKPANCLMCKTGHDDNSFDRAATVVKVADFGMATFVGVDGLVRGRCGTPGYVAPEIFSAGVHGGYGNKVDIFSAGVTLYVMLCGYEPFYGESDEELVAANREAQLEFPTNDWKTVSSEAKDLVKRMMQPDPQHRLSAREALKHPWIIEHVGTTDSFEVVGHSGVDSLSHSIHNRGESCTIS